MTLAYRCVGAGRPIVWLHGASGPTWDEVTEALAGDFRSYVPDLRGYGRSSRVPPYGPEVSVGDVVDLLDHLGWESAVLAGHSSGGIVAYLTALAHPGRVAALVLEEAPPPVPHDLRPSRPDGELPYEWDARQATLDWLRAPDPAVWERLAGITAPALIVAGGAQSHLDQRLIADMADRMPGGELVTIDAGHCVHTRQPAEFAAAVRDFLYARLSVTDAGGR
jgi:3-oxoadipate enol-lactonase